jgi:hypothetical protein
MLSYLIARVFFLFLFHFPTGSAGSVTPVLPSATFGCTCRRLLLPAIDVFSYLRIHFLLSSFSNRFHWLCYGGTPEGDDDVPVANDDQAELSINSMSLYQGAAGVTGSVITELHSTAPGRFLNRDKRLLHDSLSFFSFFFSLCYSPHIMLFYFIFLQATLAGARSH